MKKQAILINKISKKYDKNPSFVKRRAIKKYDRFIKYPIISDKSTRLLEDNKYTFMVDKRANKAIIKVLIEFLLTLKFLM